MNCSKESVASIEVPHTYFMSIKKPIDTPSVSNSTEEEQMKSNSEDGFPSGFDLGISLGRGLPLQSRNQSRNSAAAAEDRERVRGRDEHAESRQVKCGQRTSEERGEGGHHARSLARSRARPPANYQRSLAGQDGKKERGASMKIEVGGERTDGAEG